MNIMITQQLLCALLIALFAAQVTTHYAIGVLMLALHIRLCDATYSVVDLSGRTSYLPCPAGSF